MSAALTDREREIESLWDEGKPTRLIAQRLGLSRRYVTLVVARLGLVDDGGAAFARAMKNNSKTFLRALQREGFA